MPRVDGVNYRNLMGMTQAQAGPGELIGSWRGSACRIVRTQGVWNGWILGDPAAPTVPITILSAETQADACAALVDAIEYQRQRWVDLALACGWRMDFRTDISGGGFITRGQRILVSASLDRTESQVVADAQTAAVAQLILV